MIKPNIWLPNFQNLSPAFEIFSWLPDEFKNKISWPDLNHYNQLQNDSGKIIQSRMGKKIHFVEQANIHNDFYHQYEPRIYLQGEVQTRANNWHDLFNMLIWVTFPHIKSILNFLQYSEIKKRYDISKQRSAMENFLTLFDENGVILFSSDEELLEHIRMMDWKTLFWKKRSLFPRCLRCIIFGHSLHEKILNPYIGMTGHAILFKISETFFSKTLPEQLDDVDRLICEWLGNSSQKIAPEILYPIPVLGFPNWYPATAEESFYDDKSYFRNTKLKK